MHCRAVMSEQLTNNDWHGLLLANGSLAPLDLVQEDAEVGLGGDGGGQLRHQVVVVGVKKLGHVQGLNAGHSSCHGKVLVIALQALRVHTVCSQH